jgi:hypothetical protein
LKDGRGNFILPMNPRGFPTEKTTESMFNYCARKLTSLA